MSAQVAGLRYSAVETFGAFYQLQEQRRICERAFARIDALALEMFADPSALNNRLGMYTNFVNLPDLRTRRARRDPAGRHCARHHPDRARRR